MCRKIYKIFYSAFLLHSVYWFDGITKVALRICCKKKAYYCLTEYAGMILLRVAKVARQKWRTADYIENSDTVLSLNVLIYPCQKRMYSRSPVQYSVTSTQHPNTLFVLFLYWYSFVTTLTDMITSTAQFTTLQFALLFREGKKVFWRSLKKHWYTRSANVHSS